MNYTHQNGIIAFEFKSAYAKEPITFSVRRKTPLTDLELNRLELEVAYLEQCISFKVATRLNEKGQNDYRTIRETRNPFRKWVKA